MKERDMINNLCSFASDIRKKTHTYRFFLLLVAGMSN